ncbi:MAG: GTP cyclohydrolase I FolE [Cytophagales bacterium]|nr:GTP cyclohydrolase I FolE [Cytophagales bacterium]
MKQKEISLNSPRIRSLRDHVEADEVQFVNSYNTPLRDDAFEMDDETKIKKISKHFEAIMETLGLDLSDDSLRGTPDRVAKMYVKEIFSGLNPSNKPSITLFDNKYQYDEMLVEKDITFYSNCEHHFVPIYGKAHVGYFSSGKVIGLSKINRIVQYYAKRPQVQERLTVQIANAMKDALKTQDVAVVIDATHLCVSSRGVGDTSSTTGTAHFSGKFTEQRTRQEFLDFINSK